MKIKFTILSIGMCFFFSSCSQHRAFEPDLKEESTTQKGMRYLAGFGVPQDNTKAFYYLSEAASAHDPFAENELAYLYAAGKGTPQNYSKALFYYQRAAHQGLASAQYNLGLFYRYGLGTPPNKKLAKKWFQKSAAHGFEPAVKAIQGDNP